MQPHSTSRQIDMVFCGIVMAAGVGLATLSTQIAPALLGVGIFILGAAAFFTVENIR